MILSIALVVFLIALGLAAIGLLFPPATVLGLLIGVLAMLVACEAILPAAWPWQWNRGQV